MKWPQYGGRKSLSVINLLLYMVSAAQHLFQYGYKQSEKLTLSFISLVPFFPTGFLFIFYGVI